MEFPRSLKQCGKSPQIPLGTPEKYIDRPLLDVMFILVVSSVLIGFGVLVTALICRIWEEKQGEENAFHESEPAKEFPISKAA